MLRKLAGFGHFGALVAVLAALFRVVDIQSRAMGERLQRMREAKGLSAISWLDAWRVAGHPALAGGAPAVAEESRRYKEVVQSLADGERQRGDLQREALANLAKLDQADLSAEDRAKVLASNDEHEAKFKALDAQLAALRAEKAAFEARLAHEKQVAQRTAPAAVRALGRDSQPLQVSNIFRAIMAGGQGNRQALLTFAPEELAMSERLEAAGYGPEMLGSLLFPLHSDLIVAPLDDQGQPTRDVSGLRAEIAERLKIGAVDPGQLGWLAKRSPAFAASLGLQANDMMLSDDTLGGYLIPATQSGTVFDLFRARATVMRAGATFVPLPPSGNVSYPRLKGDPDFAWTDPDTTTDATPTRPDLGVVRLRAKSLRGYVSIPNDLIRYSMPSVELLVRAALAARAAVAFDDAALQGDGSSNAPKGLINYDKSTAETPAVGKLTLHVAGPGSESNGDTFIPEDVMKIIALYFQGDDPDAPTGWIMRPMMWATIANLRADAATPGDAKGPFMFWTTRGGLGAQVPEALGGHPVYTSSKVSKARVEGSSGATLTYILFGNFARLLLGMSGALELAVSEHVKFMQDKTVIRGILRGDTGVSHEQSFVFTDTLLGG